MDTAVIADSSGRLLLDHIRDKTQLKHNGMRMLLAPFLWQEWEGRATSQAFNKGARIEEGLAPRSTQRDGLSMALNEL